MEAPRFFMPGCLCDRVFGVLLVPQRHQLTRRLADVFAGLDVAGKCAARIQAVGQVGIGAVLNVEAAVQLDVGRPGAQALDLDGAPGQVLGDNQVIGDESTSHRR